MRDQCRRRPTAAALAYEVSVRANRLLPLLVLACTSTPTDEPEPSFDTNTASVEITPSTLSIEDGQSDDLHCIARDGSGNILVGEGCFWKVLRTDTQYVSTDDAGEKVVDVTVTAKEVETARVWAGNNSHADTAIVTVTAAGEIVDGCPTSGFDRLVNVSTLAQLNAATDSALAGDQIRVATGTYSGNPNQVTRDGTSAKPITICGPGTVKLINTSGWWSFSGANWWVLRGFTKVGGTVGIFLTNSNNFVIQDMTFDSIGQEPLVLRGTSGSNNNIIRGNRFTRTGRAQSVFGEGIYCGNGSNNTDPCDNNLIEGNTFGPGVTAEHVELKHGTRGNIVRNNFSNASGTLFVSGAVGGVYTLAGQDQHVDSNTVINVNQSGLSAFWIFANSDSVVVKANSATAADNSSMSWGFRVDASATNEIVYCDNQSTKNVPCTP